MAAWSEAENVLRRGRGLPFFGRTYVEALLTAYAYGVFSGEIDPREHIHILADVLEQEVLSEVKLREGAADTYMNFLKSYWRDMYPNIPFPPDTNPFNAREAMFEQLRRHWREIRKFVPPLVTKAEVEEDVSRRVSWLIVLAAKAFFKHCGKIR